HRHRHQHRPIPVTVPTAFSGLSRPRTGRTGGLALQENRRSDRVMAAKLFITRGLPASGKTTWARTRLAEAPLGTLVRLNRDDLRRMSLPAGYIEPKHEVEQVISIARDTALHALLVK